MRHRTRRQLDIPKGQVFVRTSRVEQAAYFAQGEIQHQFHLLDQLQPFQMIVGIACIAAQGVGATQQALSDIIADGAPLQANELG